MEPPEIYKISEILDIPLLKGNTSSLIDRPLTYVVDSNDKIVGLNLGLIWKRLNIPNGIFNNLIELKILSLNGNGIKSITKLAPLKKMKYLYLNKNQIESIGTLSKLKELQILQLDQNKISDISALKTLMEIEELWLGHNQIQNINPLASLENLKKLILWNNQIYDISPLSHIEKLEILYLSDNKIEKVNSLISLKNLKKLDLTGNQIIKLPLNFVQCFPNLNSLSLARNPIQNIPREIFDKQNGFSHGENVLNEVRTYLQDLAHGASANNDVKLLLLGNGGVGKTQIARRLAEREHFVFNAQHDSTHGIVLLQRTLDNLNLNIWDFAGQDIYHATHRLFMQTRALFVLVWDIASETSAYHKHEGRRYKNEKLQYWLEYARCFAPESPILVVQNKVDMPDESEQTYLEQTLEYYKTHYPIIEFVQVSAQTGYNFDVLEYWLAESFRQDENLKRQLLIDIPTSWAQVRARIRAKQAEQEKTLSVEDFKTLCADQGIPDSWHTLLQYLHDTSVTYYREGYFDNQIILDQAWAIDAVYAVLNRQSFYFRTGKIKKGRLQYADLQALWKDNTDEERKLFIDFMLSTELCFETTEHKSHNTPLQERTFVVPQLLPEDKPKAVEFEEQERNIRQISEVVPYRFLPSVFIQRFIIKANAFSKIEMMWQHGILLQWQESYAVAEADYDKKHIFIHSTDQFLIQKIKEELELIANEGKIRAAKPSDGEDPIMRGERFLEGLAGLDKKTYFENKLIPIMFIEQEIEGFQNAIKILIDKKNFFLRELSITSDANVKFSLQMQLEELEKNIDDYRQKLQQLSIQAPANQTITNLKQEVESLKQTVINITQIHYGSGDNVAGNKID